MKSKLKSSDNLFVVYAKKNKLDFDRIGITVSRKVSTRAVKRNKVKRLIRESFRHETVEIKGLDFVVIARPQTVIEKNEVLIVSLEKHWNRVKTKCKKA